MRIYTLAIAFLICTAAKAQVIRAEPFYVAPEEAAPAANLLLDSFPGAAVAYSLRKLDKDYTGSAIRVRRSSDNTEQDIGFVNNYLDTAAMKTFVGTSSSDTGRVVTWYNQADSSGVFGIKNLNQSTATLQPFIIRGGAINYRAGKPSVANYNNSTMSAENVGSQINGDVDFSFYISVHIRIQNSPLIFAVGLNANSGIGLSEHVRFTLRTGGISTGRSFAAGNGSNRIISLFNSPQEAYQNNTLLTGTQTSSAGSTTTLTLGAAIGTSEFHEFIAYNSNTISNRTSIESNINSFYSIY